jgi:hypothetical protein
VSRRTHDGATPFRPRGASRLSFDQALLLETAGLFLRARLHLAEEFLVERLPARLETERNAASSSALQGSPELGQTVRSAARIQPAQIPSRRMQAIPRASLASTRLSVGRKLAFDGEAAAGTIS